MGFYTWARDALGQMVGTWQQDAPSESPAPTARTAIPVTTPGMQAPAPPQGTGIVVTVDLLRQGVPLCQDPEAWAGAFTAAFARFPRFNRLGAACILAKAKTEAQNLNRWDEDLRYSDPARILRVHGDRAVRTDAARRANGAARATARATGMPIVWPAVSLAEARELVGNPVALGNRVYAAWGGYAARGLGAIQNTTLGNHQAFADDFGMPLAAARDYMLTVPGAAMTAPWYLTRVSGGVAAANRGDMREVIRLVWQPGGTAAGLAGVWGVIHGDQQMADFGTFRRLLAG